MSKSSPFDYNIHEKISRISENSSNLCPERYHLVLDEILPSEIGEALEQVAYRSSGCPIPGDILETGMMKAFM